MKKKVEFRMVDGQLKMTVDGETWDTCFDVCLLLCEAGVSLEIEAERVNGGHLQGAPASA